MVYCFMFLNKMICFIPRTFYMHYLLESFYCQVMKSLSVPVICCFPSLVTSFTVATVW